MEVNSQHRRKNSNEMKALINQKEWSQTPLGARSVWPQSLQTAVNIALGCEFPMVILWGEELIQIYNDGYRIIMGDNHPAGLGQPTKECWPELWEFNKPIYERVFDGETIKLKNKKLQINRYGHKEDAWFTLCFSPLRDESDAIAGVFVTVFETTGQVRAEEMRADFKEEMREREKRYRSLFESIDEGYCIIKTLFNEDDKPVDYRFLEVNPSFEKQTGLKNAVGKRMRELAPDHEESWFDTYGKIALTGEPVRFERFAGELHRWFNVYAFRFGKPEERKVAILFNDITERKQAQKEREKLLREVETEKEKLTHIFQRAPSFMAIVRGPDHVFERANDLYFKLVGNREIIGKPVREALPEVERQGFFELLDQVYQTGEAFNGTDMRVLLASQSPGANQSFVEFYLDFVYQPLRNSDGSITGVFIQGVDQTERKEAEKELQVVNETLEERVKKRTEALQFYQERLRSLASELSKTKEQERHNLAAELHDNLGQMLSVCKMKLDALLRKEFSDQTAADISDLHELVNDALIYTRDLMSELKPPPALDKENPKEALVWVAEKMMDKHGLKVTFEDNGKPKPVHREVRTILYQCVRELFFNVIKHAGVSQAHLALSRWEGQLKVSVEDKGRGFDSEKKEKMPGDGGGFGLFNIRERMDLLGGHLDVDSEPGRGTEAVLYVPMKKEAEVPDAPPQADEKKTSYLAEKSGWDAWESQHIKVLLADDHQMMREGLLNMINKQDDLQVIAEASNGQEAVKLARETDPDIIVMDVNMPVLDGIEATRQVKAARPDIRVIGLSVHDKNETERAMRHAGATAYLTKDNASAALCSTIRIEAAALS